MEDARERFIRMMDEYKNPENEQRRNTMLKIGGRLKKMNNPVGRFVVSKITTRLSASAIVGLKLFGVERKKDMPLEEIALNWLKPSLYFNIPTEVGEVTEDRIIILRPECTVGFDEPEHSKMCRASMNMDMAIIKKLGGKLTVTETILEGAQKCRHIIEKA